MPAALAGPIAFRDVLGGRIGSDVGADFLGPAAAEQTDCRTLSPRWACGAATRSRSSCRNGRKPRLPTSPAIRWARSRFRFPFCSVPTRWSIRLEDSEACIAIVDPQSQPNLAPVRDRLQRLKHVIGVAGASASWIRDWESLLATASRHFSPASTRAVDPALAGLYQRHDGTAQRRADAAAMPARKPARLRLLARRVSAAGRHVLVAGRLGVDRRADGRAAADALLRPSHPRVPRSLRVRTCAGAARPLSGDQHVPVSDGAQDDDEGGARSPLALRACAAQHHERRGSRRHDRIRLGTRTRSASPSTKCSARPR